MTDGRSEFDLPYTVSAKYTAATFRCTGREIKTMPVRPLIHQLVNDMQVVCGSVELLDNPLDPKVVAARRAALKAITSLRVLADFLRSQPAPPECTKCPLQGMVELPATPDHLEAMRFCDPAVE